MDWTLKVMVVPVRDVDRAIAFYRDEVGFNVDHDTRAGASAFRPAHTARIRMFHRAQRPFSDAARIAAGSPAP